MAVSPCVPTVKADIEFAKIACSKFGFGNRRQPRDCVDYGKDVDRRIASTGFVIMRRFNDRMPVPIFAVSVVENAAQRVEFTVQSIEWSR